MSTKITFDQAVEGYTLDARARGLSPRTVDGYRVAFNHFRRWLDGADPAIASIETDDIRHFIDWLSNTRVEQRGAIKREPVQLSRKTILNIYTGLSALWTWAVAEGYVEAHVVRVVKVRAPRGRVIQPYTKDEVQALLTACEQTVEYNRPGKSPCANQRPTAARDRALILLLLDTGARSGEICYSPRLDKPGLLVHDLDQRGLSVRVVGKGSKERILHISHITMKAIWRHLLEREDVEDGDHLFLSTRGYKRPLATDACYQLIKSLGESAGVPDAHPHRFRHTFAINFLRNGGKTLELQRLLGHASLKMVKRYVALAQVDLVEAHKRASPVANWRL